eukprot:51039-Eustigmatos_ZCMA.PRE.1
MSVLTFAIVLQWSASLICDCVWTFSESTKDALDTQSAPMPVCVLPATSNTHTHTHIVELQPGPGHAAEARVAQANLI